MSWQSVSWVLEHSRATGSDRLVLIAIASYADAHGRKAWPSVPAIACKANVSTATARRAIARLLEAGELYLTADGGGRAKTNYYSLAQEPQLDLGVNGCRKVPAPRPNGHRRPVQPVPETLSPDAKPSQIERETLSPVTPELSLEPSLEPSEEKSRAKGPAPRSPRHPATTPLADAIARQVWEARATKPLVGFPAVRVRVQEALDAGYEPEAVLRAFLAVPTFTRAALDFEFRRARSPTEGRAARSAREWFERYGPGGGNGADAGSGLGGEDGRRLRSPAIPGVV